MGECEFWTIGEGILFDGMTVEVKEKVKLFLVYPAASLQECFQMTDFDKQIGAGIDELAVEVSSRKASSIVADTDSIRIDHWQYFE
jgi:hypothetical protein